MIIFLNGKFIPERLATISVFDRGFLYGDGLFEAVRIVNGKPFCWREHWQRLESGAKFLKIRLPFRREKARALIAQLVRKNKMPDAILRLTLSRGVGVRGYSPKGANSPTFVMSLHPVPEATKPPVQWKLVMSSFRLPVNDPLARFKSANKLPQVLARAEADVAGADEALFLNTDDFVVEGASSNLFWIEQGTVCAPPMKAGNLPGVTSGVVRQICRQLRIPVREKNIRLKGLKRADGIFLSLTSMGIVGAKSLDGSILRRSTLVERLAERYHELLLKS